jgi:hypothetical protein
MQTYSGGCQCGKVRYEVQLEIDERRCHRFARPQGEKGRRQEPLDAAGKTVAGSGTSGGTTGVWF